MTDEVVGATGGTSAARKAGVAATMAGEDADPDYEAEVLAARADAGGTGADSLPNARKAGTAGESAGGDAVTSVAGLPMPTNAGAGARGASSMPVNGVAAALPRIGTADTAITAAAAADGVGSGVAAGMSADADSGIPGATATGAIAAAGGR